MNNICTNNWKEFKIGGKNGLFEVTRPNARSAQTYSDGDMPYIASGCFNNGVCGYFEQKDKNDFDKGNCITVSPVDGYAFYQKDDFLGRGGAGSSIIILRRDNLNEYVGKFICTIIRKACKEWTYSNMGNKDKLKDTIIKLPVNKNNEPDWKYMESYMKNIMQESEKNIENLQNINTSKMKINLSNWKSFKIGFLFEPLKTGFIGSGKKIGSATKKPDKEHTIPLTCAKYGDNGIMYWGKKGDFITHSNILAVIRDGAVATGMVYAEKDETGVYSHGYFIKLKNYDVSFEVNLYLSCILTKTIYPKYTRDDTCIWERIQEDEILLPVSSNNEPNWEYMENYMKNIMQDTKIKLDKMVSL